MKKSTFMVSMLVLLYVSGFSQSRSLIDNFLASKEFTRIRSSALSGFADVERNFSNVLNEDNDQPKVINVTFALAGKIQGVVQAIRLPDHLSNVLPGDERYLMVLHDYREYDALGKTGTIKVIDLNYDDYLALEVTYSGGEVKNLFTQDMPDDVKAKYSSLVKKKDLGNPIYKEGGELRAAHYCDRNGNGNVTWGECYTCLSQTCYSNPNCALLCQISNYLGNFVVGVPACTASMGASCVIISFWY